MKQIFTTILCVGMGAMSACSDRGEGFSDIPALAPLVQLALPTSLQAGSASAVSVDPFELRPFAAFSTAHLTVMFKTGSYGKISGGNGSGYINALLEDLDSRFTELKGRFEVAPACYSGTAQAHEFDFSGVAGTSGASVPGMLKLSLDLQCRDLFNTGAAGEQSGTGSGMVFGKSGSNYSLGLLLNEKDVANSGFGYVAKVTNKGAADEEVNLIFAEARSSLASVGTRSLVTRVRAVPGSDVYEMAMASSDAGLAGPIVVDAATRPQVSCGFHGITNGTLVYIKAIDQESGNCGSPSTAYSTASCFNASDLSSATLSNCDALKDSMTIGDSDDLSAWDYQDVTAVQHTTIYNAMQFDTDTIDAKVSAVQ